MIDNFAKKISNLVKLGLSIEIMDGDNSFVPIKWVSKIFSELN